MVCRLMNPVVGALLVYGSNLASSRFRLSQERETVETIGNLKVRNDAHGTGLHYRYDGNTEYEEVEE